MQKEENKFVSSTILEGMVSVRAVIKAQNEGISDRKIKRILYSKNRMSKIGKEIAYLTHEGERKGFSLVPTEDEALSAMALGSTHGGILCECTERTIPHLSPDLIIENGFYVMIEGIEDPYNFGYALRSLYALGVSGVVLTERNWMSAAGVVARASAGASELLPLFRAEPEEAVDIFKSLSYEILCADIHTDDTLENTVFSYPSFLIVGGEKRGISRSVLKKADKIIKISYGREFNASLSAASATTILAYEIAKQNRK